MDNEEPVVETVEPTVTPEVEEETVQAEETPTA